MKSAILCIGTEMTTGLVQDINAYFLSRNLTGEGYFTKTILFVPDSQADINRSLDFILGDEEIGIIIITGGLGPTDDDLTREILAERFGKKLIFIPESWNTIVDFYQKIINIPPPENNKKQAYIPEGSVLLENKVGTAPSFMIREQNKLIYVLPGVPKETEFFWQQIKKGLPRGDAHFYRSEIVKFCGIGESQFEMNIKPLLTELPPSLKPAYLPSFGEVWFYLYSDQKNLDTVERAERVIQKIKDQYHQYLFTPFGDTLEEACGQLLCRFHLTLSTAESCTGGLLIHRLTNISGSSQYVNRGYVVYSNKAKENDLAIPELIIQEKGAVSEEVARLLAEHVREKTGTDFGIGITGIAGPTGGLETKPVGLVYIALAEEKQTLVRKHIFSGDRIVNKTFASQFALTYLFQALRKKYECLP